jgi:DNA (cytosine-5)-methyltransferase 1
MNSVELFAGGGGLAIGLQNIGFKHKAIIEFNKDACNTLLKNSVATPETLYHGDVCRYEYSNLSLNNIDLVSGGPPCQPFSLAGNHKGLNDGRDMFPEAVRAIRELRPKAFIFENVKGLLRKSFAEYFEYILLQLQHPSIEKESNDTWLDHLAKLEQHHTHKNRPDLEYKVVFRLLNCADYGAPQKRERVFIVGFRHDIDAGWSFPKKTHSEDSLLWSKHITGNYWKEHKIMDPLPPEQRTKIEKKLISKFGMFPPTEKPWRTVRDAIANLPDPHSNSNKFTNHEFKSGARSYPGHTGSYIDEPSKTLKAGAHGVPGGENMIRYEDGSVRYFTVRESARIQTFPDSYFFEGAWGESMRQLGNAVPVCLAEAVGSSVKQALIDQALPTKFS